MYHQEFSKENMLLTKKCTSVTRGIFEEPEHLVVLNLIPGPHALLLIILSDQANQYKLRDHKNFKVLINSGSDMIYSENLIRMNHRIIRIGASRVTNL